MRIWKRSTIWTSTCARRAIDSASNTDARVASAFPREWRAPFGIWQKKSPRRFRNATARPDSATFRAVAFTKDYVKIPTVALISKQAARFQREPCSEYSVNDCLKRKSKRRRSVVKSFLSASTLNKSPALCGRLIFGLSAPRQKSASSITIKIGSHGLTSGTTKRL